MRKTFPFLICSIIYLSIFLFGCRQKISWESRDNFKAFYDRYHVTGSFTLFDQNRNHYIFYNQLQYRQQFTPASTFKICNSLIGLETGVITDENFALKWDSVIRPYVSWNKDQDLRSAYKNSCVWYYQEVARRIGGRQMKYWLDKAGYGNRDTGGGIDKFWLRGNLRISPAQQIAFLQKLHDNKLPFSKRSVDIVKSIMIAKDTNGCIIRAKTGWGQQDNKNIGWYVGYIETKNDTYYFANCIQSDLQDPPDFAKARTDIFYRIIDELGLLK